MTPCDSCGELTRHPCYFDKPYWICCPRCADKRTQETGQLDNATAKNLALEDAGKKGENRGA